MVGSAGSPTTGVRGWLGVARAGSSVDGVAEKGGLAVTSVAVKAATMTAKNEVFMLD